MPDTKGDNSGQKCPFHSAVEVVHNYRTELPLQERLCVYTLLFGLNKAGGVPTSQHIYFLPALVSEDVTALEWVYSGTSIFRDGLIVLIQ